MPQKFGAIRYSEAEIGALKASSQVLLFTSATVIESRPEKGGFATRNSLSSEDAESLLDQLRPCAWAPV